MAHDLNLAVIRLRDDDAMRVHGKRPSRSSHCRPVHVATSDFTEQARSEMSASGLKPIALIDGPALAEFPDVGIGVAKRQVEVIRFDPSKLDEDLVP